MFWSKWFGKKEEENLEEIGDIVGYFAIPKAAVVQLTKGALKIGDEVVIKGHTTHLKQKVTSMQIDHKPIESAQKGVEFGMQVKKKVRRTDKVYRVV